MEDNHDALPRLVDLLYVIHGRDLPHVAEPRLLCPRLQLRHPLLPKHTQRDILRRFFKTRKLKKIFQRVQLEAYPVAGATLIYPVIFVCKLI
jgi:hypothetical protein